MLALILAGLGLIGSGLALLGLRRAMAAERAINSELRAQNERLGNELRALVSSAVGTGRKLALLEDEVRVLAAKTGGAAVSDEPLSSDKPYQMAARLMQRGADVEELMSVCGLTRGEAELLASLHRRPRGDIPA
ncbi:MAG: DUF2802 domain-containing protein [Gammaproteobacteria bacterium]|nr:DUF2802 domain-containing protein [Gammaproteobacteria bacterium]